jgi:hypothetical protein
VTEVLNLTLGCLFSDRVEALADGRVVPEGCRLTVRFAEAQALFRAVLRDAAYDVAELSLGSHIAAVAAGRHDWLGLPIFPSRAFRQANLYIRHDRIHRPEDLAGKRIGLIDYQQTAALWVRGLLADDHAVRRDDVQWITGGLHAPVLTDRAPGRTRRACRSPARRPRWTPCWRPARSTPSSARRLRAAGGTPARQSLACGPITRRRRPPGGNAQACSRSCM